MLQGDDTRAHEIADAVRGGLLSVQARGNGGIKVGAGMVDASDAADVVGSFTL